jgi:prepilin-type N-terminal cleavage/methylation domain-containing protein
MGTAQARRAGFTLVELLVVMGIILALVALSASASMRLLATQKVSVTETTITKVDSALRKQWDAVLTAAQKEDIAARYGSTTYTTILGVAGNDTRRARVIYVKLRLRQEFPMNYAEALSPSGPLPAKQSYAKYLSARGKTGNANPVAEESSACLLMALREGRSGGTAGTDDFGATSVDMVNGIEVLVDGWRRPLAFYRWPTDPGPNNEVDQLAPPASATVSRARDPQDPDGLLIATPGTSTGWWYSSGRMTFENSWCHSLHKGTAPYAYYMIPVIVSAGPNGQLGITAITGAPNPPADVMVINNQANANDNICNYRLQRLGARGD